MSRTSHGVITSVAIAALATWATNFARADAPDAPGKSMAVPAYFYDEALWDQTIRGAPTVQLVVVNPASGPGDAFSVSYATRVAEAQAAGMTVVGYVHTLWGTRALDAVKDDIDSYMQWYSVDGIFLDEAATGLNELPYYDEVNQHIKSYPGQLNVINPGTYPHESYMTVADIVVAFEDVFHNYETLQVPGWVQNYGTDRFWHVVYGALSWRQVRETITLAGLNHVRYLYVADNSWNSNPYDALPRFWDGQLQELSGGCGR